MIRQSPKSGNNTKKLRVSSVTFYTNVRQIKICAQVEKPLGNRSFTLFNTSFMQVLNNNLAMSK